MGFVMAGHSRSKNGVASARLCPACGAEAPSARRRPGHPRLGRHQIYHWHISRAHM